MPARYNMPAVTSSSGRRGESFRFIASVDMTNLPTLPERMDEHLKVALAFHLKDAAQRVVDVTRGYLVRLEEPAVKVNAEGKAIHGYDTGLMYISLLYKLVEDMLQSGVYYDILSEEAEYWRAVEFGHFTPSGNWWPGYHMLETAIHECAGYIRQRVREAWLDTARALARESHVPGHHGPLGFTR